MAALTIRTARRPSWSTALTAPLAARIPTRWRPPTLVAIKTIHTLAFVSIGSLVLLFLWDGITGRAGRRAVVAATVALSETAVFASNNLVCPLTPLAEELGAERGSVTDIFLPEWLSVRIPLFSGTALVAGLFLHFRHWRERRTD